MAASDLPFESALQSHIANSVGPEFGEGVGWAGLFIDVQHQ